LKVFASSLASLLLLGLCAVPHPALAAATTAADAAAAAAGAAPASPDAQAPGDDQGGDDQGEGAQTPPPEAPVPDPFLADAYKTCIDGASGDKGTFQRLEDAGWNLAVDGDTQTPFYQAFSGQKDYDGVGTVNITFSQEVYPTMTEGYCSLSIDSAQRKIGIADLKKMPGLKGEYRETDDGVASNWEDAGTPPKIFIQADQHKEDLYFLLDVTTLLQKPAADLPFVQPQQPDDNGDDDSGGDGDPGASANN
jgi:hypothetical protein